MSDWKDRTPPGQGSVPVGQRPDQGTRLTGDPGEAQADEALGFSDSQTLQGQPSEDGSGDPRLGGDIEPGEDEPRGDSPPASEGAP